MFFNYDFTFSNPAFILQDLVRCFPMTVILQDIELDVYLSKSLKTTADSCRVPNEFYKTKVFLKLEQCA